MKVAFDVRKDSLEVWVDAINKSFNFLSQVHVQDIYKCIHFMGNTNDSIFIETADGVSYVKINDIPILNLVGDTNFDFYIKTEVFTKILSSTSKELIHFSCDSDSNTIVIYTETQYKIPTISGDGYAIYSIPEDAIVIPSEDLSFIKVLDSLIPFAAKELVRPELAGVSVSDDLYVSTIGTHGVIYPRCEQILQKMTISPYAIKFLCTLNSIVKDLGSINIYLTQRNLIVKSNRFVYFGSLPVNEFPYDSLYNMLALIPDFSFKVLLDNDAFVKALYRVLLLESDKFTQLKLEFEKDFVTLSCVNVSGSYSEEKLSFVENIVLRENWQGSFPFVIYLGINSVESIRRLFGSSSNPIQITVISENKPIFVKQRNMKYLFYSMVMRNV